MKNKRIEKLVVYSFAAGVFVAVLAFAGSALAASPVDTSGFTDTVALGSEDPRIIVAKIVRIALGFMGVISTVLIMYGGWLWMKSKGDKAKIETAQKVIVNAVIGMVIILSSLAITQFILNSLIQATGFGGSDGSEFVNEDIDPFSDSLGRVLDSHFPPRNATDIARNVNIAVSFFEPVDPSSLFVDFDGDTTKRFELIDGRVNIYRTEDGIDGAIAGTDVHAMITDDHKQLVFDPVELLGSNSEDTLYEVELTNGILLDSGSPAFDGRFSQGYKWRFTVNTEVDLTPPSVVRVIPVEDSMVARNMLVQIYYSEAVNPVYASGSNPGAYPPPDFLNVSVSGEDGVAIEGRWDLVNQYTTGEFISSSACGENSCGETIYCLPGDQVISGRVVASSIGAESPISVIPANGVVDMYGNSLDGDGDGVAEGTGTDDFVWSFSTTDEIVLDPPKVTAINPPLTPSGNPSSNVPFDQDVSITFDSMMSLSTMNGQNVTIHSPSESLWVSFLSDVYDPDEDISGDEVSVASIDHGIFSEDVIYGAEATSGLRNIYQNCFTPSKSSTCSGNGNNCCNDVAQDTKCVYGE